jgi:hypothetical protein
MDEIINRYGFPPYMHPHIFARRSSGLTYICHHPVIIYAALIKIMLGSKYNLIKVSEIYFSPRVY